MGTTINLYQALDIFEENIDDIYDACIDNMDYKLNLLKKPNIAICKSFAEWWVRANLYQMDREEIIDTYTPTIRAIEMKRQPKSKDRIDQSHIEQAKEYPIEAILGIEKPRGNTNCPFHKDKKPSFQIKKNNKYTCYSCGEYGDSISLYQKLNNTDFVTAVKNLT